MKPPPIEKVHASKVPAVRAFMKTMRELEAWKAKHAGALAELAPIAERYNAQLAAATEVTKQLRKACGPFDLYEWGTQRDPTFLLTDVGREAFEKLGGVIVETPTFDPKRFDALVVEGKISEAVAAEVVKFGPRFHRPGEVSIP